MTRKEFDVNYITFKHIEKHRFMKAFQKFKEFLN